MNNRITNFFLNILCLSILVVSASCGQQAVTETKPGQESHKIMFFLSLDKESLGQEVWNNAFKAYNLAKPTIHFVPIFVPGSVKEQSAQQGINVVVDYFISSVLSSIDENSWDKSRDSFYFCGFDRGGLAVLDSIRTLKSQLNIKKVALISTPLGGAEMFKKDYPYHDNRGPIKLLLKSRGQKVHTTAMFREVLPGSEYLVGLRSFLKELASSGVKVYLASASIKGLVNADNIPSEIYEEIDERFKVVARSIRNSYSSGEAPSISILAPLAEYLANPDKQKYYALIKYAYDGEDHNGFWSVLSQEANEIEDKNITRAKFNGYFGGTNIGLLSLIRVDLTGLFDMKEYTLFNRALQDSVFSFFFLNDTEHKDFSDFKDQDC
jgi:hypothetical protein